MTRKSPVRLYEFTKHQSTELVEDLLERIKSKLESGEDTLVSGFGKFCVNEKAERRGRNPATGEDLMLAPRRVVTFKLSGKLRKGSMESTKKIVCIYCGSFANIRKEKDLKIVVCPHCKRETELDTYRDMFNRWVDEIRKE